MDDFIRKLADNYASFVKFLTWFVGAVTVIGIISAVSNAGSRWDNQELMGLFAVIGFGVFGIAACGASAVVIDIMQNIRSMSD